MVSDHTQKKFFMSKDLIFWATSTVKIVASKTFTATKYQWDYPDVVRESAPMITPPSYSAAIMVV